MSVARKDPRNANTAGGITSNERELQLLNEVASRNRPAFEQLYLLYHRRLERFLMRLTSRYEIAEEVINDTFWTVWEKARDFRGASLVSTWIMGIAYKHALRTLRKNGRTYVGTEMIDTMPMEEDVQGQDEMREWLTRGLAELPLEQRMVLEFTYLLGHSCEEVAAIMECPINTVKTRMFHARQKLKASLPRLAGTAQ